MAKLIDLEKAIEAVWGTIWLNHHDKGVVQTLLRKVPTVEVVHGKWESVKYTAHCSCGKSYGTYHYLCSACNRIAYAQPYGLNYCPNCGAKMDGGKDNG